MATTEEIATLAAKIADVTTKKTAFNTTTATMLTAEATRDGCKAVLDARVAAGEADLGVIGTALTQYVDTAILAAEKRALYVTADSAHAAAKDDLTQYVAGIIANALFP